MKISCIQMNMRLGDTEYNFRAAEELIKNELEQNEDTDVIVLPETWNTGFFPRTDLASLCDKEGERTKKLMSSLAAKYSVNIVAGSVADIHADGKIYNSAYIFDRNGNCIASYDKTHLFTPMGEHNFFEKGDHLCRFTLDGVSCAIIICYDIRFPELTRTLALGEGGLDVLFIVSQWPKVRTMHLRTLVRARAIENQMFTVCCNSCGLAGETQYAGSSLICDPWGEIIADAQTDSTDEKIIRADADMSIISGIRSSINVFADRREALYSFNSKRD